jgi:hypothetical protein
MNLKYLSPEELEKSVEDLAVENPALKESSAAFLKDFRKGAPETKAAPIPHSADEMANLDG